MSIPPASILRPVVVGLSHRTAAKAMLDRVFVADDEMIGFLSDLRAAGIGQAIVLSTCDRVEAQGAAADAAAWVQSFVTLLATRSGLSADELRRQVYFLADHAALRHMFGVAGSLESQVLGEPQVLGQVKEAHRLARDAGLIGPELEAILQAGYTAAKRVRSETTIGERPVTLASAAVQVARDVHGDLAACSVLMIGPGDMGDLMVEHFRGSGLKRFAVTAPNAARAEATARAFDFHVAPFDPLEDTLAAADIVIAALGTGRHTVTVAAVRAALRLRRRRPMLFIDLGVPSDIDPGIEPLDGAFRYDLDDLERVAMSGRVQRGNAAEKAWVVIDAELAAFERDRAGRQATPAIVALRRHFEAERTRVLVEAGGDAARATELLVNRLLHQPSETLRRLAVDAGADPSARRDMERLMCELFAIRSDGRTDGDVS